MGIAIAGMHYAGMKAAQFPQSWPIEHRGVDGNWLAMLVSVVALTILGITLLVSLFDARLQARTALLASSLAQANQELATVGAARYANPTTKPGTS
ncbi:putative exported protein [Salmonella bongori]|nr:putative exported protein [Salmonella bongori]